MGVYADNTVVMFPENTGRSGSEESARESLVYQAPRGTRKHLITGLQPNAGYRAVCAQSKGGFEVTVSSNGGQRADAGGVLTIDCQSARVPVKTP